MPSLVRLKHYHTNIHKVSHPLLDVARSHSEEDLQEILKGILDGSVERDVLTMALRSALGNMLGRYKANWPQTIPFMDDMVSEGFLALSRFSSEISLDFLAGRAILKVASQRMQDQIETYLNFNQAMAAASISKQQQVIKEGLNPLYCVSEAEAVPEELHPADEGDEWKRDILEVVNTMDGVDDIGRAILARENWGLNFQDLADALGVGVGTIHRRKVQLYSEFLELTR